MRIRELLVISSVMLLLTMGIACADDTNSSDADNAQIDAGSFAELQSLIDDAPESSAINLTKDYVSHDDDFPDGIRIGKPITINGNDHVLDANYNSRIFTITSSNVVLNNIKFINGQTDNDGGAIKSKGGATIRNCVFENNHASAHGGAIYQSNGNIYNSTFTANTVAMGELTDSKGTILGYGGAIYQENSNVYDSTFKDNGAFGGGAIQQGHSNIYNSVFRDNSATDGGAVKQYESSNIYSSTFIENSAAASGGAVQQMEKSNIYDSIFRDNSASYGGAVHQSFSKNSKIYRSSFENNYASYYGGAVYQGEGSEVHDSAFTGNAAGEHGGAVFQEYESATYNSTFKDNHAEINDCDDICNHENINPDNNLNIAEKHVSSSANQNDAGDNAFSQKSIMTGDSKNSTGNPVGLLIMALIAVMIRSKKF